MKRKANTQKLILELNNQSPARADSGDESPKGSGSSSPSSSSCSFLSSSSSDMSVESSCVSSLQAEEADSSPENTAPMALVGCPRCLMYVMLSEVDPKCPRCKTTVFLDFLNEDNSPKNN